MRWRRGLSLIETVVAVSLLAVALMAILTLCPASNAVAYQANIRMQVDNLAQSILERERLLPLAQLQPQAPTALAVVHNAALPDLYPSLEIVAVGAGNRAREIRVKVTWTALGRDSELTRATVVTFLHR